MSRKRIAREGLYLVSFALFGFVVLPVALSAVFASPALGFTGEWWGFYRSLGQEPIGISAFVMAPYLAFLFVRSVRWCIVIVGA